MVQRERKTAARPGVAFLVVLVALGLGGLTPGCSDGAASGGGEGEIPDAFPIDPPGGPDGQVRPAVDVSGDVPEPAEVPDPGDVPEPAEVPDPGDAEVVADLPPQEDVAPPCEPSCSGLECGGDGCGGLCGECDEDWFCVAGVCQEECVSDEDCVEDGLQVCSDEEAAVLTCEEQAPGCLRFGEPTVCPEGDLCLNGACFTPCTSDCLDKECGDDGCGGSCGPTCDDDNPCTDDVCQVWGLCVYTPNTEPCDDEDGCTVGDACLMGACAGAGPTVCDDDNECTIDSCDPGTGCLNESVADASPCDDGDACTEGEICFAGGCTAGDPVVCDDEDPCTGEGCDPALGCTYELLYAGCEQPEISCDDGLDNDQNGDADCADEGCFTSCCADGFQSGDETGVDCGGACLACPGEPCDKTEDCVQGWCDEDGLCKFPKSYFWVGGSGEWSDYENHWATTSGGDTFHPSVPTNVDDVFFDASSFAEGDPGVELDMLVAACRHMDWTGATGSPVVTGATGRELIIKGDLTLSPEVEWASTGTLTFTGAGGKTIDTQGVALASYDITLDHPDGAWTLLDPLSLHNGYLTVARGSFDTAGHALDIRRFISDSGELRTILLNDSTITLGQFWFMSNTENLTFDAGTSTVVWNASNTLSFHGGDQVFYLLNVSTESGTSTIQGDTTFTAITKTGSGKLHATGDLTVLDTLWTEEGSLTLGGASDCGQLVLAPGTFLNLGSGNVHKLGALDATGTCTEHITIHATDHGEPATLEVEAGPVIVTYGSIRDITATGGAQFHGLKTYDEGGNTGWVIDEPEPQDYYWIGGSGSWSDPLHWSNESGGEPAECLRGATDNVFFDQNSFEEGSSTVTLDVPESTCHHMDWTGAQFEPVFTGGTDQELVVTGDVTLVQGLTWSAPGQIWLRGIGERSLDPEDVSLGSYGIHVDAEGVVWSLGGSLHLPNGYLHVDEGTLHTNGEEVHVRRFISNNANIRTIDLGDSTITVDQYWFMQDTTNLTFDAGTSTILWNAGNTLAFEGGGAAFHVLQATIASGAGYLRGHPSFHQITKQGAGLLRIEDGVAVTDTLHVTAGTVILVLDSELNTLALEPGVTLALGAGAVQTVDTLVGDGTCSQYVRLESTDEIGAATLSVAEGPVDVAHYQIQNINAVGGATFTATSSLDTGGNTGWSIVPSDPIDYFWVGGSGSWGSGEHWAHESDGAPTPCAPTFRDSAIFDAASFPEAGANVTLDLPLAECHHMAWTGVQNAPNVQGGTDQHLAIYGDLTLDPGMSWSATGDIRLEGPGDKALDPQGVSLGSYALRLDDAEAAWTLASELVLTNGYLFLEHGAIDTAGHPMSIRRFISDNTKERSVALQDSTVTLGQYWFMKNTTNLTFDAGTSTILWNAGNTLSFEGGDATFHHLQALIPSGTGYLRGDTAFESIVKIGEGELRVEDNIQVVGDVTLTEGSLTLRGTNTLGCLTLSSGTILRLKGGITQTVGAIGGDFTGVTTILESTTPGSQATLSQAAGAVCLEYAQITDIVATGGATFHAAESIDGGNNDGWAFGPCLENGE